MVDVLYEIPINNKISENGPFVPRENTGLSPCDPLVTTFHQQIKM